VGVDEARDDDALARLDDPGIARRNDRLLQEIRPDGRDTIPVDENVGAIKMGAVRPWDDVAVTDQDGRAARRIGWRLLPRHVTEPTIPSSR